MAEAADKVAAAKQALAEAEAALNAAKGTGVANVIAATKAVQAAKKEVTAAEKGVSTAGKTRTQVLQEQRTVDMTAKAEERAKTDVPVAPGSDKTIKAFDIQNRPDAPPSDGQFVYYYSWVGGATTGQWKLYRAPATQENIAAYGSRSIGGRTQVDYGTSSVGAQGLAQQPRPILNPLGQIIGWARPDGTTVNNNNGSPGNTTINKKEVSRVTNADGSITVTFDDGSVVTFPKPTGVGSTGSGNTGSGNTGSGNTGFGNTGYTGSDPATLALIQNLQAQIAALSAGNQQAAIDKAAADAAAKKEKAENAITVLTDRFTRYGLASLVPKIRELAIGGASENTITLQLQETEEYRQRFRANQDRIKKGLSVLDPGDYLGLEDDYRQILRAYGLRSFDNDDYVQQFISNDISTTELTNRVVTAVQRVQNADPAILTTLRGFYGITDNDLVAYVLDPQQQFQKIERQVAAAEIGAAAKLQGINAGVAVSEQLAAQGITKAQAQKGYATIADILPTAEKLSDIYGKTLDEYRLGQAEQEVFNTLASAQRKRQKLSEREVAAFSGTSGVGKSSLSTQLGGTF